jgi:hypothetical protein
LVTESVLTPFMEFGNGSLRVRRLVARISDGQTIRITDAHRGDGKRFVVRVGEKLTTFIEIESAIRSALPKIVRSIL